jgi:hypothetical protein
MRSLPHWLPLLLAIALLGGEEGAGPFWGVVQVGDPSGTVTARLISLSASSNAPELKALKDQGELAYAEARAAWDERRKAWEADAANRGKAFRSVEPEPRKPVVKLDGAICKTRAEAESLLARRQQDDLFKRNPGLEWRRKAITDRLLQHFTIGVEAPAEWHQETRQKNGCQFACNMSYLSHVVDQPNDTEGANTWWIKYGGAENHIKQAQQADIIAWFTWYGLAQAPPARYKPDPPHATPINAKTQSTMIAYWSLTRKFMQLCAKYPEVPVVLQIEPDEWGHLLLSTGGMDPDKPGTVLVGGSGLDDLKGLPDTITGWAKGFRLLRDLYAPHVILCANPSAWDRNGTMSGANWAKYFKAMDVTPEGGWDLFVIQLHDWDRGLQSNGANAKWPPYLEKDVVTYHGSVDAWCQWTKEIHDGTGLWACAWQLPVGNATYAACDGSDGHGSDGVAELLLEDYPRNTTAARMAAAGCCMWIFSHGGGGASAWDAHKDGITNPTPLSGGKGKKSEYADDDGGYLRLKGGEYFKAPVPILGRAARRGTRTEPKGEKPGDAAPAAAAKPAPALLRPEATAAWTAHLLGRVREEVAAGRHPRFAHRSMRCDMVIEGLQDHDVLEVKISGAGVMAMPWSQLKPGDLLGLALALVRDGDVGDHACAAFFLYLDGQVAKAEGQATRAGAAATPVKEAFGLQ